MERFYLFPERDAFLILPLFLLTKILQNITHKNGKAISAGGLSPVILHTTGSGQESG
jgi:hypothetical protein